MAEEGTNLQDESRSESRIKELSNKVELTAKERDEKDALLKEQQAKAATAEKERDFYMQFSDIVAGNPQAKEHKDEILEKVKAGYSAEDAAIAVLAKAGKYTSPAPVVERVPVAGGSAPISITSSGGEKSVAEMSQSERRAALLAAEARGDIGLS